MCVSNLRSVFLPFLLALFFSFGIGAASAAQADPSELLPQEFKDSGELVVGGLMDVPPMGFYTMDGDPTGINSGLAHAMEALLGVDIHFKQYDFAGLRPALQSGAIDFIWDSMNDTVARQKVLDFIDYLGSPDTLLLADGNPKHIASLADMCGMVVATPRGAVQIKRVQAVSKQCTADGNDPIELKLYGSAGDGRLQVQTGRADAFIGNGPVLFYIAKTADDGSAFDAVKLPGDKSAYYGMAFQKDDTQLRKAIGTALQIIIDNGEYQKVLDKYGLGDLAVDKLLINSAGK